MGVFEVEWPLSFNFFGKMGRICDAIFIMLFMQVSFKGIFCSSAEQVHSLKLANFGIL
jgi:hypothetical protein